MRFAKPCTVVIAAYTVMVRPIIALYGVLRITAITMFLGAIGLWWVHGLMLSAALALLALQNGVHRRLFSFGARA